MSPETSRTIAFVAGLAGFLAWEWFAPHHRPLVPRLPRWFANLSLSTINAVASAGLCAACLYLRTAVWITWRLSWFEWLHEFPPLRLIAEVAALDFVIYWQHRLFHTVPWLWRFHRVHHTDDDLDVTSASRFHLGEVVVSSFLKIVVVASGISLTGLVVFEGVLLFAAQFQHSNIALSSGVNRVLWYTFVPPEMHRVHHCPERRHHDANYGTLFTFWDRLFGTLAWLKQHDATFGLSGQKSRLGVWGLLCLPLRRPRKD